MLSLHLSPVPCDGLSDGCPSLLPGTALLSPKGKLFTQMWAGKLIESEFLLGLDFTDRRETGPYLPSGTWEGNFLFSRQEKEAGAPPEFFCLIPSPGSQVPPSIPLPPAGSVEGSMGNLWIPLPSGSSLEDASA